MNTLDFLNQNSLRSFPIRERQSKQSADGLFIIPDSFLLDCQLSLSDDAVVHISQLHNYSDVVTVELADQDNIVIGSFTITVADHTEYDDYAMVAASGYFGSRGKLTVGRLDDLLTAPSGKFSFTATSTRLETRCVSLLLSGISTITFIDADGFSKPLTGAVTVSASSNIRFRYEDNVLIMDAGENLGLNKDCGDDRVAIKTINGISPDAEGEFTFLGSDCAAFSAIDNGLLLTDTCSKPCLGCTDLTELVNRSVTVDSEIIALRNSVDQLQERITQLTTLINYTYDCQNGQ